MPLTAKTLHLLLAFTLLTACDNAIDHEPGPDAESGIRLESLGEISIDALRKRSYGGELQIIKEQQPAPSSGRKLLASYTSDNLRVFARIDLPEGPTPKPGFPVLIFVHGWVGLEGAPGFDFMQGNDSLAGRIINGFREAGFIVISPALRGHGTIDGQAAEGIEFIRAWDNASYISPIFYTIDTLNLIDSLDSLESIDWLELGITDPVRLDRQRISISGHSQGGDVALAALAVSGEGSSLRNTLVAGSIISGCFGTRFEQLRVYGPMANTTEAFMAGDGRWTGSATAPDGRHNPDFIFGWPPDWIGTTDTTSAEWTWQADVWSVPTVQESLNGRAQEMYSTLRRQVGDLSHIEFEMEQEDSGAWRISHDPLLTEAMAGLDSYRQENLLTEDIHFHHSDQDYYSPPGWNAELTHRVNQGGGQARDFTYPRTNHSLNASEHRWFSPGEVLDGVDSVILRDIALFNTPGGIYADPTTDRTSIAALRRYAGTLSNEFSQAWELTAVNEMPRSLLGYTADGLQQYALLIQPSGTAPEGGWPVLVFNHGYHPDPPNYAISSEGVTDRPGDYYRGLPETWAMNGFMVIVPDYRGHNASETDVTASEGRITPLYARDVIAAVRAIPSLPRANRSQIFLSGHSMGAEVTLLAALALGDDILAASLWSGGGDFSRSLPRADLATLQAPLILQHAIGDETTPARWSIDLHDLLQQNGRDTKILLHESTNHLFQTEELSKALAFDLSAFQALTPKDQRF